MLKLKSKIFFKSNKFEAQTQKLHLASVVASTRSPRLWCGERVVRKVVQVVITAGA